MRQRERERLARLLIVHLQQMHALRHLHEEAQHRGSTEVLAVLGDRDGGITALREDAVPVVAVRVPVGPQVGVTVHDGPERVALLHREHVEHVVEALVGVAGSCSDDGVVDVNVLGVQASRPKGKYYNLAGRNNEFNRRKRGHISQYRAFNGHRRYSGYDNSNKENIKPLTETTARHDQFKENKVLV